MNTLSLLVLSEAAAVTLFSLFKAPELRPLFIVARIALLAFLILWLAHRLRLAASLAGPTRGVRLNRLLCFPIKSDDRPDPDNAVFPDTRSLRIYAEAALSRQPMVYPLSLSLRLLAPGGAAISTLQRRFDRHEPGRVPLAHEFTDIASMLQAGGSWTLQLVLDETGAILGSATIQVLNRSAIAADLEVVSSGLFAPVAGQLHQTAVIFTSNESIIPALTLRARSLSPSRFASLCLHVELIHCETGRCCGSADQPIHFDANREMRYCDIGQPIADTPLATQPGHYEFRFAVENRPILTLPFRLLDADEAVRRLQVGRFDVLATHRAGRSEAILDDAYRGDLLALAPAIQLSTPWPSAIALYDVSIIATIDGAPLGLVKDRVLLPYRTNRLICAELAAANLPDGRCAFTLVVNNRCLAVRNVRLHNERPPQCTDAQGRLKRNARLQGDAEAEVARLMRDVNVVA